MHRTGTTSFMGNILRTRTSNLMAFHASLLSHSLDSVIPIAARRPFPELFSDSFGTIGIWTGKKNSPGSVLPGVKRKAEDT